MTMLNRKQLTALTSSLRDEWVLSVYIDGTSSDPAQRRSWRAALDQELDRLRDGNAGASRQARTDLDRAVALLEERLGAYKGEIGAPGWVGFIGADKVHHAGTSATRMPNLAIWEKGAHVAPCVREFAAERRAVLVVADARKAEIHAWHDGRLDRTDSVHAFHAMDEPTHMGNTPRSGFHTGTRGGTGHDRVQRALNAGSARMQRDTVARVTELARPDAWMLVAGTPQHRHELAMMLAVIDPERLLELDSVDIHASPTTLADACRAGCDELRARGMRREIDALIEAAGARGPAALGPETTRWALDQSRVQALYVTPRFLERQAADAEAAVRAALSQNAAIEELDDGAAARLDAHGGVGARLRYGLV